MEKILVFTTYYPHKSNKNPDKITNAVHYFCKEWIKLGYEVVVFYLDLKILGNNNYFSILPRKFEEDINDGVKIYKINITRLVPKSNKIFNIQNLFLKNIFKEILDINKFKPDYIITHFPIIQFHILKSVFKEFDCPKFFTLHNTDINYIERKKVLEFNEYVNENNIKVFFRSKKIAERYNNFFNILNKDINEDLIYSGAPLDSIPTIIEKKSNNSFLYVGQLVKNKNVDIILRALSKLKLDFTFNIIGEGPEKDNLMKLSKDLDIVKKVNFLGKKTRKETLELMNLSQFFVMVSSPETFGLVYIESLSVGCITIASKGEGIDGVIKTGFNGFLVNPGSIEELYQIILELINLDQMLLNQISKNAIKTGIKFSEAIVAEEYLKKVINKKRI